MTVELYSDKHFFSVARLIENFHAEAVAEYDDTITPEAVTQTIEAADKNNLFLLIVDGICQGILYGIRSTSPVSGKEIFQEIIWYVNKPFRKYGVRLLKDVEKILKSNGVSIMIMVALENSKADKLKSFYPRLGYRAMETHFVRSL